MNPSPADEKIIDWTESTMVAWEDDPGISNRLHMGMLSGKLVTAVQPASLGAGTGYHNSAVP